MGTTNYIDIITAPKSTNTEWRNAYEILNRAARQDRNLSEHSGFVQWFCEKEGISTRPEGYWDVWDFIYSLDPLGPKQSHLVGTGNFGTKDDDDLPDGIKSWSDGDMGEGVEIDPAYFAAIIKIRVYDVR